VEQCFEKLRRRYCCICSALCGCFVSGSFKMQENAVYRYLTGFGQAVFETARSFLNTPGIDISDSRTPYQIVGATFTILDSPLLVPAAESGGALELAAAWVNA
jgi:hypothetical protein